MAESTTAATTFPLLTSLFGLLVAHRPAFGQERPYQRATGLVLGWLLTLGRHTLTRLLVALGLVATDWSAFYRLLGVPRFDYDRLTGCLLRQTLPLADPTAPYLVAVDGVVVPRHSHRMPGTSWLAAPSAAGDSRAVPLRWEPAFPPKAIPAVGQPPRWPGWVGCGPNWTRRGEPGSGC